MPRRAFTLIELLVVIAVVGLLSTIAVVSLNSSRINARNTTRKANLVQISKALELYYSDNNGYPSTGGVRQGNCGYYNGLPDSGASAWIPNFQNYMARLPHDPNSNKPNPSSGNATCQTDGTYSCYAYASNGTDYKVWAHCVPEGPLSATDPFYDPLRPTWSWAIFTPGGSAY